MGEHVLSMVISTTTKGRELQATSVGSPVSEEALVWPLVDVGSSRFVLESRIMYTQQCEGTRRRLHKKNSLGLRSRVKPSSPPSQLSAMHELTIEEEVSTLSVMCVVCCVFTQFHSVISIRPWTD